MVRRSKGGDDSSSRIPYPHYIDHTEKVISIKVQNWMSACGASKLVEKWYPGYRCDLVSEERLETLGKKE